MTRSNELALGLKRWTSAFDIELTITIGVLIELDIVTSFSVEGLVVKTIQT